jgi:site-specific DNA-methyltransferase (adenine-specific)
MISEAHNKDCLEAMRKMKDNEFELGIVDPPYGIGQDWKKRNKGARFKETTYKNTPVDAEYFDELKRVCVDYIIWGWNYYTEYLGSTNYLIVWDKKSSDNDVFKYSKCEIALTTKKVPCNLVTVPWDGYRMGEETGVSKIHPHQKPIALYKWLLKNYAKEGDKILDTHLGSGSSRIASHQMGFNFVGYEIDKYYFEEQEKRFKQEIKQLSAFDAKEMY